MEILPRSAWGAAPPRLDPVHVDWPEGGTLWVHYSAGPPPGMSPASEQATIRAIQALHQGPSRAWADIGYGYVVAPSGRVYTARGYGIRAAHCPGHNDEPSVCLLWKDGASLPPQAALDSVMELALHLGCRMLAGHREGFPTACPGDAIFKWVEDHREVDAHDVPLEDPLTLRERLAKAGFGGHSIDQIIVALRAWDGKHGVPRIGDSDLFRRLRTAGFGPNSTRRIIYALRRAHQKESA